MTYTYPWNNAVPAGSDPANQLDTNITDLKSALSERMEDKFISSMTADPWVVKPEILGNVTGKEIIYTWGNFNWFGTQDPLNDYEQRNSTLGTTLRGRMTFVLPLGVTITGFKAFFGGNGIAASTIVLSKITYDEPPVQTTIATLTRTNATVAEEVATGLPTEVTASGQFYHVLISLSAAGGGNSKFHFVKVTYTTPDCRNTL